MYVTEPLVVCIQQVRVVQEYTVGRRVKNVDAPRPMCNWGEPLYKNVL